MLITKQNKTEILKIIIGCVLYALSVVIFLNPVKLIPGSVAGVAVVANHMFGIPIGVFSIVVNIPLMIIAFFYLGKKFLLYTGFTILLSSSLIDTLSFLQPLTNDLLLNSIFGGVVMGVGLGLILDAGASTGGTTILGRLTTRKHPGIQIGNILLVVDFIIILGGTIAFKDSNLALYSIIDLYICVVVINKVMYGFNIDSIATIGTKESESVINAIKSKLPDAKVTIGLNDEFDGEKIISCTCKKKEITKLQKLVQAVDKNAYCTTIDVNYSFGLEKD